MGKVTVIGKLAFKEKASASLEIYLFQTGMVDI